MPTPTRDQDGPQLLVDNSLARKNLDGGLQKSLNHLKDLRIAQVKVLLRHLQQHIAPRLVCVDRLKLIGSHSGTTHGLLQ